MTKRISAPDLSTLRARFPSLERKIDGLRCVFADAPGGTQVPDVVAEAMTGYLRTSNANAGGGFVTSAETDALIAKARRAGADFLGAEANEVVFGPNMTTLAFALSRSLARTLGPGDEVVVTKLDHDANIAPWVAAAEDSGATVRYVDFSTTDCTLDPEVFARALGPKTRLVSFTLASNAVGSITPALELVERARQTDALVIADAVHIAQHRPIDVASLGVDFLFCSPYKFFGPHLGMMFGRHALLKELSPYKVRPSHDEVPDRWETGTANHEALAGLVAAVDYIAGIGDSHGSGGPDRRSSVIAGLEAIRAYESSLSARFLEGLSSLDDISLYGIGDIARVDARTPTFAVRVGSHSPRSTAEELGRRGIFVWDGNYYALALMEELDLEDTGGAVRIGFCHYNSIEEIDRVVDELGQLSRISHI